MQYAKVVEVAEKLRALKEKKEEENV